MTLAVGPSLWLAAGPSCPCSGRAFQDGSLASGAGGGQLPLELPGGAGLGLGADLGSVPCPHAEWLRGVGGLPAPSSLPPTSLPLLPPPWCSVPWPLLPCSPRPWVPVLSPFPDCLRGLPGYVPGGCCWQGGRWCSQVWLAGLPRPGSLCQGHILENTFVVVLYLENILSRVKPQKTISAHGFRGQKPRS